MVDLNDYVKSNKLVWASKCRRRFEELPFAVYFENTAESKAMIYQLFRDSVRIEYEENTCALRASVFDGDWKGKVFYEGSVIVMLGEKPLECLSSVEFMHKYECVQ